MKIEIIKVPQKGKHKIRSFDRRYDEVSGDYKGTHVIVIHGFDDPGYESAEALATAVLIVMDKIEKMR